MTQAEPQVTIPLSLAKLAQDVLFRNGFVSGDDFKTAIEAATSLQKMQTTEPMQNMHRLPEADANGHTMFGALVFHGTRLPVSMVAGWIRQGEPNDKIREAWPDLTDDQIDGVRELLDLLYPATPATSGYMQVVSQPSPVMSPHSAGVFPKPEVQTMLDDIAASQNRGNDSVR